MKRTLRKICPKTILNTYSDLKFWIRFHFFKKRLISEEFKGLMGYDINWDNPQDINEKINWMKLYGDTSEWPRLADKYLVREYVKKRIGEQYLTKLYGVWKNAKEIDFDTLPESFVLKTNHGAGTVLPVFNKSTLDIPQAIDRLNKWLKIKYGYRTIEPHYLKIRPLVYAEQLLLNDSMESKSIIDYKVFCFYGQPAYILVCKDRIIGKHTNLTFFDINWNIKPDMLSGKHAGESTITTRPKCLDELLYCASILSKGHPQVRVDFYIVNDKIYFGEMTFTSQGGYMDYISRQYSVLMGDLIKNIP